MEPDRIDMDNDNDSADVPDFARGTIDPEQYLRMRNAHTRRLRGLMEEHGLRQRSFRHVCAGVRRREQRAIPRQGCTESAGDIKVSRDIHKRLVLADCVVRDKAWRSRRTRRLSQSRRGVDVAQGRAYLWQKSRLCLLHIFSSDLLVQTRLLEC